MSKPKAYLYSINPLDSANGKWDYELLRSTFERNSIEQITVESIPNDERCFVVIPGHGNAGKESKISKQLQNANRIVLFITGDESAKFDIDKIQHPNISIWVQYPHEKHKKYNKFFVGVPQHLKENLPEYPVKEYDIYFGGQITNDRRIELGKAMQSLPGAHYKPTEGFAQGQKPKEYYETLSKTRVAPCPAGAQVIDTFRFFESIEMLAMPIGDLVDSKGVKQDYFKYVYPNDLPITKLDDWGGLSDILPGILSEYPKNMHKIVAWWIKYKRDFSIKIMKEIYE